jgi:3-dehydroquinate synthase
MKTIEITLPRREASSIKILVGREISDLLFRDLQNHVRASRYCVITDSRVKDLYGENLTDELRRKGLRLDLLNFPEGEVSKRVDTLMGLASKMLEAGIDRSGCLIALGGGVVGDTAGFLASIYMRSIPYIHVPTSLLAQVDSSIGGKTGIDLPEGKNLLGTFYHPLGIYVDLSYLSSLETRQIRNGLAEVIKYGCIQDEGILQLITKEKKGILRAEPGAIDEVVTRSCHIKVEIVEADETERGRRKFLNFGHTLGHAIEAASGFELLHGEAVALGMIAASRISRRLGPLSGEEEGRILEAIRGTGLPTTIPRGCSKEDILRFIESDKKKVSSKLTWVLLSKIGEPILSDEVPMELVENTIEAMLNGE